MTEQDLEKVYSSYDNSDYSEKSSCVRFAKAISMAKVLLDKEWKFCSVLDYGCGPGNMLKWLDKIDPCKSYYGYDLRKKTIDIASSVIVENISTEFGIKLPLQKSDVVFALGTISYQCHESMLECYSESISIIKDAVSKSNYVLVFTLPRGVDRNKKLIRYELSDVENIFNVNGINYYFIDALTFSHEFIIGCSNGIR